MRLYDKVLTQLPASHPVVLDMHRLAKQTTVIIVDEIAAQHAANDRAELTPNDFPYARPPWNAFFIEWRSPEIFILNGVKYKIPKNDSGVFGLIEPLTPQLRRSLHRTVDLSVDRDEEQINKTRNAINSEGTVLVNVQPFGFVDGRTSVEPASGVWLIDKDGTVLSWWMESNHPGFIERRKMSESIGSCYGLEWFHICWLAFTFANCKNVSLNDVTSEVEPRAKIKRRLRIPDVRRYTLSIAGNKSRAYSTCSATIESSMPFHLCRGHFATYTADKPMFGNPKLVGRYWHPPHMRGKKEHGEVIKDYSVDEPTAGDGGAI